MPKQLLTTPPSSVVFNMQGRESGGSWFETCSGIWYPRRRPCGVAINTLVDSINWLGKSKAFFLQSAAGLCVLRRDQPPDRGQAPRQGPLTLSARRQIMGLRRTTVCTLHWPTAERTIPGPFGELWKMQGRSAGL